MELERRDFLKVGGVTLLGLAAACGKNKTVGSGVNEIATNLHDLTKNAKQTLQPVVAQPLLGKPHERLSIGLIDSKQRDLTGGRARAWFAQSESAPMVGPIDLEYHGHGFTRSTYIGRISLPAKGPWLYFVEAFPLNMKGVFTGGSSETVGVLPVQNAGAPPQPYPGVKAISVPTPTVKNPRGVSPICTLHPMCTMHHVSLDVSLRKHRPIVLVIGTPAFCQSRFCGPVVQQLMEAQKAVGSKADFIHIELYKDDKNAPANGTLSPGAKAWRVEDEPAVYYIQRNGVIADWTIGPSDSIEMVQLASRII
ncbi:MAG: hypothetical protein ACYDCC_03335 [Actinomycetota bacterium]